MIGDVQDVVIPYKPRKAFIPLHERTQRWGIVVAHRRAGKTVACINDMLKRAMESPRPDFRGAYIAPFYKQAKAVVWDYLKRFSAPIPGIKLNEAELRVDYPNGARIQLYGADNADALRGLYFDGIIADEYGDWRPSIWDYVIRPALADRGGWAIIIGTPKGRNQFYETFTNAASNSEEWFSLILKASNTGLISEDELLSLKSGMTDDAYLQEFECDFSASLPGAIFGKELRAAEEQGRLVESNLYDPNLRVHAVLDLGYTDDTAIWWFQVDSTIRFIDYYAASGESIAHYNDILRSKKYRYSEYLWLPHDARAKSLQTGKSIVQQFNGLGWRTRIVPELSVQDGIQAARFVLQAAFIDKKGCHEGLEALYQYQREWDDNKKCFKIKPKHDWTSHASDSFRYASLVCKEGINSGFNHIQARKQLANMVSFRPSVSSMGY